MTALRTLSLLAATLSTGLGAGVFVLYAHTIMPGLGATDDRTFVAAFQSIDRAILNTWFIGGSFFGALVFGVLASALTDGQRRLTGLQSSMCGLHRESPTHETIRDSPEG